MRAFVLVAALLALTLAILQPLAHAVMLRTGGPEAAAALWGAICQPTADGEAEGSGSSSAKVHDCCFGLAHSPVLLGPAVAAVLVDQSTVSSPVPSRHHHHPSTGAIRDGPQQPRAPPLPND